MPPSNEILKIRPSSRLIRTIGKDLIKDAYAAIVELVKNSYDADSPSVKILIDYQKEKEFLKIVVTDKGHGMSLSTITDVWLVPATSDKLERKMSPEGRVLQGRKGIGRYAAGILGDILLMESTDKQGNLSKVVIDFAELEKVKYLSDIDILVETGETGSQSGVYMEMTTTNISPEEVADSWNTNKLAKLELELQKLKLPLQKNKQDNFDISLEYINMPYLDKMHGIQYKTKTIEIKPLPILDYYDYRISGEVDDTGKATITYENQNIPGVQPETVEHYVDLKNGQKYCGKVVFDFRVFDRDPEAIDDLLNRGLSQDSSIGKMEARRLLDEIYGIGIYRGMFRIRPYGDQDYDWLDLDKDRVQSFAMNIGMNQIAGFIEVEPEERSHLHEKSARDGLAENSNYLGLRAISRDLIKQVLQPRRFAFRSQVKRGRKNVNVSEKLDSLFDFETIENKVDEQLETIGMSVAARQSIVKIIQDEKKDKEKTLKDIKNTIAVYQGQVTLGKMTEVVLHEGRKNLRYLNETIPRLNRDMDRFLKNPEASKQESMKSQSEKLLFHTKAITTLFKRIEPLSRARIPNKKITNIRKSVSDAADIFTMSFDEYNIEFINEIEPSLEIYGREYDLITAFSNFIENSVYWLAKSLEEDRRIVIKSDESETHISIEIYDNGPGIPENYAANVFDPGFTLKEDGTGLGMSIAAEALKRSGGVVSLSKVKKGTLIYLEFAKGNVDDAVH